ncbi:hypothetical protein ATANTOWER_019682 [Ataeniobius toweri]|uniref:Secreted protein n=1 Tax=Ataeniobius toweri TaxID=208326 RepID=A0ABU7CC16_9TELE|nr:hypothetical protein [Ataeniobius toweri]
MMLCLLLFAAVRACMCVLLLSSLPSAGGVGSHILRDAPLIASTTQDSRLQHVGLFQTETHIKVTPPAAPETLFITRDLNLFHSAPYKRSAETSLPPRAPAPYASHFSDSTVPQSAKREQQY